MSRSIHLRSALIGGLIAGLIVTALPAVAATVGDALELGKANTINQTTTLKMRSRRTALVVEKTKTGPVVEVEGKRNVVKITAAAGKAPILVNREAGTAKNLSADAVDGYDADGLLRVAFDASNDLPDGDDLVTFPTLEGEPLSLSITAPTAGWLVITGTVDAFSSAFDFYACNLGVDGSQVDGTLMVSQLDGAGNPNQAEDCTTHGVQEVAAGAHTVTFRLISVATAIDFRHGALSAMFVPFDGTGASSTCKTNPCP